MTLLQNEFTRFSKTYKISLKVNLKYSSFWPSAHVKSMCNDPVYAIAIIKGTAHFKNVNGQLYTNIYSYLETLWWSKL
jgi:hypothetical protein